MRRFETIRAFVEDALTMLSICLVIACTFLYNMNKEVGYTAKARGNLQILADKLN